MAQDLRLPTALAIVAVTVALGATAATNSIPQLPFGAAPVSILLAILTAAVALTALAFSLWEVRVEKFVAQGKSSEAKSALLLDRQVFVAFIDAALAASNQTSRSILLIEIEGLTSSVGVPKTIGEVVERARDSIVATMSADQFAILISALTSDQVISIAEEILATFPATDVAPPLKVSIGICFCLPNTTAESALKVSAEALRLAKRRDTSAYRSIAEGGVRAISGRPVRAPTLSRILRC